MLSKQARRASTHRSSSLIVAATLGIIVGVSSYSAAAPVNDDIANAIALSDRGTARTVDLTGATAVPADPICGPPVYQTIWYSYTSPVDQFIEAHVGNTTGGTGLRPRLSVWAGPPGALGLAQCHPDAHAVEFQATAGVTYYFQIASPIDGGVTLANLNVNPNAFVNPNEPAPPANDLFWYAEEVTLLPFATVADVGAGRGDSQYDPDICGDPSRTTRLGDSLWYSFTATDTQEVDALFTGSFDQPYVGVFTGSLDALQFVACSFEGNSKRGATRFTTAPGAIYSIEFASAVEHLQSIPTSLVIRPSPRPTSGSILISPNARISRTITCPFLCQIVTHVAVGVQLTCEQSIPSVVVSVSLTQGPNQANGTGTAECSGGTGSGVISMRTSNDFRRGPATATSSAFDYDANFIVNGAPTAVTIGRRRP